MRRVTTFGTCLVLAASVGCNGQHDGYTITGPTPVGTIGSGNFVSESRTVSGFTSIAVSAGGHAIVTQAGIESLEITAEDNILPLVEAIVAGGRLTLGFRANAGGINAHGVTYRIGVRDLRSIQASSGSRIEVSGIDAPLLAVDLSSGAAFTGSGRADRLDVEMSAGSQLHASALQSRAANARLSSGSNALIRVRDSLLVTASSASVLEFLGDPQVQAQTSSGAVVRRAGS